MEIHLQSDGQLYPPPKPPAKPKPPPPPPQAPLPPKEPCPPPSPPKKPAEWEDFLILAVMFIIFRSKEEPDLFLLAALAYILFDSCFSLKNLL